VEIRRHRMTDHDNQDKEGQVGFNNMRSLEVLEKERMALQEPDCRIDQVRKRMEKAKTMIMTRAT
jgi:hypothetical protein